MFLKKRGEDKSLKPPVRKRGFFGSYEVGLTTLSTSDLRRNDTKNLYERFVFQLQLMEQNEFVQEAISTFRIVETEQDFVDTVASPSFIDSLKSRDLEFEELIEAAYVCVESSKNLFIVTIAQR